MSRLEPPLSLFFPITLSPPLPSFEFLVENETALPPREEAGWQHPSAHLILSPIEPRACQYRESEIPARSVPQRLDTSAEILLGQTEWRGRAPFLAEICLVTAQIP